MDDNSDLRDMIRTIPDHPKPGILFRDISTLMLDGGAFSATIDRLADALEGDPPDLIAGIEARGFVFASALAYRLGCGVLMLRKRGKLPGSTISIEYALEYGTDMLEMHDDACGPGANLVLVDDLIATGGTALAAVELLRQRGARVNQALFVIDLPDLGGAERLREKDVAPHALIAFEGE
ncbi:adenine phosphoribosyltransferase [Croceicoccus naphthovorans]|uniref:Adenine phosphoribosyltransferase n=1 Tax=Croceicoccus naphthovorans TaxID=1348774 RepID=A0A0G3XEV2_9SPHN|nr:adenine phosphoribosyltransferase [Croceicoccus naphthovorans]AKM09732.1 adenine phosphoribosyltransferase [Croceicoccus naphthovorans]MBB3990732.1 adenine phosphoribosyltransferase [Croceicoccus naphthovorans]